MAVNNGDVDMTSVEFTLEETLDELNDIMKEREKEVKELMNIIQNNEAKPLGPNITPDEIRQKRLKFLQSMEKFVLEEQPRNLPLPNTLDYFHDTFKDLENEVRTMQELEKVNDEEIAEIKAEIIYTEQKKTAFDIMKEASIIAAENEISDSYEAEMKLVKAKFKETKKDLQYVVDELFPDNIVFQQFLTDLTRAYSQGGDDVYIDVTSDKLDITTFLEEADIIRFHPHDKTKVRLRDL